MPYKPRCKLKTRDRQTHRQGAQLIGSQSVAANFLKDIMMKKKGRKERNLINKNEIIPKSIFIKFDTINQT